MTSPNPIQPTEKDFEKAVQLREKINSVLGMNVLKRRETEMIATAIAETREAAAKVADNAACNTEAKYTCCLENGLNARLIIAAAIRGLR